MNVFKAIIKAFTIAIIAISAVHFLVGPIKIERVDPANKMAQTTMKVEPIDYELKVSPPDFEQGLFDPGPAYKTIKNKAAMVGATTLEVDFLRTIQDIGEYEKLLDEIRELKKRRYFNT